MIISPDSCRIIAGNAEGVRRGIYYLEDLLLGADGPFLKTGSKKRSSWVKNRISYFLGQPPCRTCDELLDDGDYYSDEYLNRLAHEGINGLWKRITFGELCKTSFTPENGTDSARRLGKLRQISDKCLRYGIKTYIFCIEPAAWNADSPALIRHPELGGVKKYDAVFFCPFSEPSQKYLYESVYSIFKAVPGLGGMINISYGERDTTCLSDVWPTDRFKTMAQKTVAAKAEMSAKIQVGCSHEIESVPFVPVPSLLYRKYRAMHELGVSSMMLCWGTGNYPGLMNKASGNLAFEDFTGNEKEFLTRLALPDWGARAGEVVRAWELFAEGYSNYPLSNLFQYYGPMHDGIVWPLHLYPAQEILLENWMIHSGGASGDAIGECLDNHSIEEAVELCREMSGKWADGVKIMKSLCSCFKNNPARLKDIGLAEAIGIQFESGYNILRASDSIPRLKAINIFRKSSSGA